MTKLLVFPRPPSGLNEPVKSKKAPFLLCVVTVCALDKSVSPPLLLEVTLAEEDEAFQLSVIL